jgi:hypothetical protein
MNSMYLQLLQTCCSCLGQGVPKNQEIVNSVVFQKYSDILITVRQGSDRYLSCDWSQQPGTVSHDLYIQPYLKASQSGLSFILFISAYEL